MPHVAGRLVPALLLRQVDGLAPTLAPVRRNGYAQVPMMAENVQFSSRDERPRMAHRERPRLPPAKAPVVRDEDASAGLVLLYAPAAEVAGRDKPPRIEEADPRGVAIDRLWIGRTADGDEIIRQRTDPVRILGMAQADDTRLQQQQNPHDREAFKANLSHVPRYYITTIRPAALRSEKEKMGTDPRAIDIAH